MGKVIALPRIRIISPARRSKHTVRVRILDEYHPEYTRWKMQFHVQNAGGYRANKGFTDECTSPPVACVRRRPA